MGTKAFAWTSQSALFLSVLLSQMLALHRASWAAATSPSRSSTNLFSVSHPHNLNPRLTKVILNGNDATYASLPTRFAVHLDIINHRLRTRDFCTGVVVKGGFVLTGGHCLNDDRLEVTVSFGPGRRAGFQHSQRALDYMAIHNGRRIEYAGRDVHVPLGQTTEDARDSDSRVPGRKSAPIGAGESSLSAIELEYDERIETHFLAYADSQEEWTNYAESPVHDENMFEDIGLIKIKDPPPGYESIEFASNPPKFRRAVYVAGYGYHGRKTSDVDESLRWSQGEVIGLFAKPDELVAGYQIYWPQTRMNACHGDSGGPAYVFEDGKPKLLALVMESAKGCSAFSWLVNPSYFQSFLDEARRKMSVQTEI